MATLLAAILFASVIATPSFAKGASALYEYKEPYMRDAVYQSIVYTDGALAAAYTTDLESIDTIRRMKVLLLGGLGLTELPDLSEFTSLECLVIRNNPISDISAIEGHPTLRYLDLANTKIETVPDIPNLDTLYLASNPQITDISYLENNTKLIQLNVNGTSIQNLPYLPSLKALEISDTNIDDISILLYNTEMQWLFMGNTKISDFSAIEVFTELTRLYIGNNDSPLPADVIMMLSKHQNLTEIALYGSEIPSISEIINLNQLNILGIWGVLSDKEATLETLSQMRELTGLVMRDNLVIDDISFVENMPNLEALTIMNSAISDITPLQNASQLKQLNLDSNQITDLSPLKNLAKLSSISMNSNNIESLVPLSGILNLQTLSMDNNKISDISPLNDLQRLTTLALSNNHIENISSLKNLYTLLTEEFSHAEFYNNPIIDSASVVKSIPHIALGTKEDYDRRNDPFAFEDQRVQAAFENMLLERHAKIFSKGTQTTYKMARLCTGLALTNLGLTEIPDLSEFKNLWFLDLSGNEISDISQVAGMDLQGFVFDPAPLVDLAPLYSQKNLFILDIGRKNYQFTADDIDFISNCTELEQLIVRGKGNIDFSSLAKLANLTHLTLEIDGVIDIAHLSALKALAEVSMDMSQVTELIGLEKLPNLTTIKLQSCELLDLSVFSGLKKLKKLIIGSDTSIESFTALQKIKTLESLELHDCIFDNNQLVEIAKIPKLNTLLINGTSLPDLSYLSKATSLKYLGLVDCDLENIEPIAKLTKLEELSLGSNEIEDIEALKGLKQLKQLFLQNNKIENIEPFASLTRLVVLDLKNNQIRSVEALAKLANLQSLDLSFNKVADFSSLHLAGNQLVQNGNVPD